MNIVRVTALVLGSGFFFPVSCTTGVVAGIHVLAGLKARDATRGEEPHPQAYLLATLPNASLTALPFSELDKFKKTHPQASFLLPTGKGEFSIDELNHMTFVASSTGQETQTVEARLRGDDSNSFFRYEASRNTIKPQYTKIEYFGDLFAAFPFAFAIAFCLYLKGRHMQKKMKDMSSA